MLVVALHGTLGEPSIFAKLHRDLGLPVLALSYGRRGTDRIADAVSEVADVIAALPSRFTTIHLVGHSLGGLIALEAARDERVTSRIGTIVGLGASWRGVPRSGTAGSRWLTRHTLGHSFVDLMEDEPLEVSVPDGIRVVSIISSSDSHVPETSSRLGEVVCVGPIPHNELPTHTDAVAWALGLPGKY